MFRQLVAVVLLTLASSTAIAPSVAADSPSAGPSRIATGASTTPNQEQTHMCVNCWPM